MLLKRGEKTLISWILSLSILCQPIIQAYGASELSSMALSSANSQKEVARRTALPSSGLPYEKALGDFDELNQILSDAKFRLPDMTVREGGTRLTLTQIVCQQIQIGDIQMDSSQTSSLQGTDIGLVVLDLDMICNARYDYDGGFLLNGRGDVRVTSLNNNVGIGASILRNSASTLVPPTNIEVSNCNPNVNINNIDFDGGFLGWILNLIEGLARGIMETLVEELLCTELIKALANAEEILRETKIILDGFAAVPNTDPLQAEKELLQGSVPESIKLLDLQRPETSFGQWVNDGLKQAVAYLGNEIEDPTASGGTDLRINSMLREFFLDENGALVMNTGDWLPDGGVLFYNHDILTETTFYLDQVELVGLDTLNKFDPLSTVGQYTFENQIAFEYLAFRIEATLDIRPSSKDGSVIDSPQNTRIVEQISITTGLGQIQADVGLLAALNQDTLERLKLGSLFQKSELLPCLFSTIFKTALSTFTIEAADIFYPWMDGFISVGLDRLFGEILEAGFLLYESILLQRAPSYFQTNVRSILNEEILDEYMSSIGTCQPFQALPSDPSNFVDFRDLLLDPDVAAARGGTGEEPYGNLFSSFVAPSLQEQVMDAEKFNERFVGTFTKAQSGVEGSLKFDGTIVQYQNSARNTLYDAAFFRVSNLQINNLDTVANPLNIMDAKSSNYLANFITMDGGTKPLEISANILLAIGGGSSPLSMANEIELTLSIPETTISLDFMANMRETDLLNFPLSDTTNVYCWLSALGDTNGDNAGDRGKLDLLSLSVFLTTFSLDASCVSCSSPGASFLSTLLSNLNRFSFQAEFTDRMLNLIDEMLWTLWRDFDLTKVLNEAPLFCPHRPEYDPSTPPLNISMPTLSTFSVDSMETMLAIAIVGAQASLIVAAQNHILSGVSEVQTSDIVFPENSTIADWTNLSSELGEWADFGLDELRKYLVEPVKYEAGDRATEVTPRLLSFLDDYVLDDEGAYSVMFNDTSVEAFGLVFNISQVQLHGLDTLSNLDLLRPSTNQVLENNFQVDNISFTVDGNITIDGTTKEIQLSYSMKNISAQLDLLVAVNLDKLEEIRVGSVFESSRIIPCLVSALEVVQINTLSSTIEALQEPKITGFFSPTYQESIDLVLGSMLDAYRDDILEAAPIFFDSTFKNVVNALLPEFLDSIQGGCPVPPEYSTQGLIDFRDLLLTPFASQGLGGSGGAQYGDLFINLYDLLVENVLRTGASSRPVINDIFRYLSEAQSNISGTFLFPGNLIDSHSDVDVAGLSAEVGFRLSNVTVKKVDSVGDPLDLFGPVNGEANMIQNTLSFGVDSKPLELSAVFMISLTDGVEMNIKNEMRVDVLMEDVVLMADILLKISENAFAAFPIRDLKNVNCWLATVLSPELEDGPAFRGIGLEEHSFSVGNFSLTFDCTSCTSPDFDQLLMSLYDFENATEFEGAIKGKTDGLFDTDFFPVFLDQIVDDAARRCPHHPKYDPEAQAASFLTSPAGSLGFIELASSSNSPSYFSAVNAAFASLLFVFGFCGRCLMKRRNRQWEKSLSREGAVLLKLQQEKDLRMRIILNSTTTSLIQSAVIPRHVRFGVPVAIVLNIGLYLGGHFGTLSVLNIDAALAGEEFTIYEFLEFRFFESAVNTYKNGGAEMAVLLIVFTGIWPYIKLCLSLLLWVLPPSKLSVKRRGQALLWIDALARLSVVDIFTMLLAFAVLLVFIGGPDESFDPTDVAMYAFKIIIMPRAGFYCLIVGQRMSRVSSSYFLECHERVVEAATESHEKAKNKQSSFEDEDSSVISSFASPNCPTGTNSEVRGLMGRTNEPRLSAYGEDERGASGKPNDGRSTTKFRWGTLGVVFGAISILVIFIIGCIFAPAVSLDTSSIAGLAVESDLTYSDVVNKYGVFLVVSSILVKARFVLNTKADFIGFTLLILAGLFSVGIVFFMQAYQFIKRKLKEKEIGPVIPAYGHSGCGLPFYFRLYKYRHMEIYLISVAIGVWQLGSACSYAIKMYCDLLQQIYSAMAFLGLIEATTAECARIQTTMPINLVVISGAFLILLVSFCFQAAGQYRKNIGEALRWMDEKDVPRLSLAWSRDRSKNSRYSHLTTSLSFDQLSEDLPSLPPTPRTISSSPPGTPQTSEMSNNSDSDSNPDSPPRSLRSPLLRWGRRRLDQHALPSASSLPSPRRNLSVQFDSSEAVYGDREQSNRSFQPPQPPLMPAQEISSRIEEYESYDQNDQGTTAEPAVFLGYRHDGRDHIDSYLL